MDDPNPALRSDGTLKDAGEMKWLHSPSDEQSKLSLPALANRPQSPSPTGDQLSKAMPLDSSTALQGCGLADKEPAKKVGKRRIALSSRAREQSQEKNFFTRIAVSPGTRETVIGAREHAEGTTVTTANKRKLSAAADFSDLLKKPKGVTNGIQSGQSVIEAHSSCTSTSSKSMTACSHSLTTLSTVKQNLAVGDEVDTDRDGVEDSYEEEPDTASEPDDRHESGNDTEEQVPATKKSKNNTRMPVRKHASRGDDPRTADIRCVMTADTVDGRKGYWCEICKSQPASAALAFMTGATSSLRRHIARNWDTHQKIYEERMAEEGLDFPEWAPKDEASAKKGESTQTQLRVDGMIRVVPKWTKEGLLEHLMQFVVLVTADV